MMNSNRILKNATVVDVFSIPPLQVSNVRLSFYLVWIDYFLLQYSTIYHPSV